MQCFRILSFVKPSLYSVLVGAALKLCRSSLKNDNNNNNNDDNNEHQLIK